MLRSQNRASLVAPFAAVIVAAVSACGGGSDSEVGSLSKGAFATKSNAICAKAEADRTQVLQQLSPMPSGAADADKLQSAVTIDRELVRRVDALVPPETEQDRVDRVLDAWRQRAKLESQYAAVVGAMQDPQTLATFTANLGQIDATADPIANELGMTQCTRGAT